MLTNIHLPGTFCLRRQKRHFILKLCIRKNVFYIHRCVCSWRFANILFVGLHDLHSFSTRLHNAALYICILHPPLCHHVLLLLHLQGHPGYQQVSTFTISVSVFDHRSEPERGSIPFFVKGNCIIYQKEINFRLVLCYGVLYKRQRWSNLFVRFDACSVSSCVYWICLFTCLYDVNNRAVGKINGEGGLRDSIKKIHRMKNEWKMAKIALIVILLYVISWSPYSCVALTAFAG